MRNSRLVQPELLDAASAGGAEKNLADLVKINRWFGGHRLVCKLLAPVAPNGRFSVLDVGAASGDHARFIKSRFPDAKVICLDRRARNLLSAPQPKLAACAFQLPFPERSFDFVICSLLLHHFSDDEVVELLGNLYRLTRRSLIVTDLERHVVAYYFLPATRWLFGWNTITLHDGPISVQAGFRKIELEQLAARAGLVKSRTRRHPPWFRLSLVASR
jgi:SAM-dependent methyltransferase